MTSSDLHEICNFGPMLLDPGAASLWDEAGKALLKSQQLSSAAQFLSYANIASARPDSQIAFRLAMAQEAGGAFEDAAQRYLEAASVGSDVKIVQDATYRALGCFQKLNQPERICAIAETLTPADWDSYPGTHETIGLSYLELQNFPSAVRWLYSKPVDPKTENTHSQLLGHLNKKADGKLTRAEVIASLKAIGPVFPQSMHRAETFINWVARQYETDEFLRIMKEGDIVAATKGMCAPVILKRIAGTSGYSSETKIWARKTLVQYPTYGRAYRHLIPEEDNLPHTDEIPKSLLRLAKATIINTQSDAAETNNAVIALKTFDKLESAPSHYFIDAANRFANFPIVQYNVGAFLNERAKGEDSEPLLKRALVRDPSYAKALSSFSVSQCIQLRSSAGIRAARRALCANPNLYSAVSNLAIALRGEGDLPAAIEVAKRGLAKNPDDAIMRMGLAFNQLSTGAIEQGFENYLSRWAQKDFPSDKRPFPQREWCGEKIARGRKIAVYMEQGMGDELMFSWFLNHLDAVAPGQILVECDHRLIPVFSRTFPSIEFFPKAAPLHPRFRAPDVAYKLPAGHLPHFFSSKLRALILERWGMALQDAVRGHGWIKADPARVAYWRSYLDKHGGDLRLTVGVAWRSGKLARARQLQYLTSRELVSALPDGCLAVNLQYVYTEEEIEEIERAARTRNIRFLTIPDLDLRDDLNAVCDLCAALDVIATPLTSTAFMGGSLGVPTFVVRSASTGEVWQQLGTPHIPWLPSIRLFFRDPREPWDDVLQMVRSRLSGFQKTEMAGLVRP